MEKNNIAFTVCTANYLAHAKAMLDSLSMQNPSYKCYIFLLDEINGRFEENYFYPYIITPVKSLNFPEFEDLCRRYNLFELSCALKPFCALYILQFIPCNYLFYFDTDILIFVYHLYFDKKIEFYYRQFF